jgi:hypothetical protein
MSIIENRTLERYEFKYFLRSDACNEIINHVKNFMSLDKFAEKIPSKNYFVRSIYFEDESNSNFDEKINGFRIRKKFRIRYYNVNLNNDPIYLETKGRNLERTYKRRVKIDQNDLKAIEENKPLNLLLSKYPDSQTIKEFVFEYYKKKLKPKVLIDYNRKPFVNNHGLYFRLTFDQNLSCVKLSNSLKNISVNQKIKCKAGFSILEVKFERTIPLWFHRIIQTYNLRRESISKFVLGMCYTNLGEETSD